MLNKRAEKLSKIRNIGIMAHVDAGKTTTTERILYLCRKINKIREVRGKEDDKGATMDYMGLERERGITIQSAATTVYWKEHQINIIDTPGHIDFTVEVERSLRVLDGGIVVMDGKKGVEAQTETVWRQANKYDIPRIIFVNKMDGVENEEKFTENLKSIREKLKVEPLPVQFPIGVGRELTGIVDIIEQKAYYYHQLSDKEKAKEEEYQIKEIPPYLVERAKKYRQELLEKILETTEEVVEQNKEMFLKYLEGQELSTKEIKKVLRQATLTGECFPVFCGSAYKHIGVNLLLEGVVDYLPSPLDIAEVLAFPPLDKNKETFVNYNSPLSCLALAFKIIFDDHNQRVTFVRVYAGKISAGSLIYNVNQKKEERVGKLVRMHANTKESITEVGAGDIAAIVGLKYTITGDTFGDKKNSLLLETINFAEPVISQAIEPRTSKDQSELEDALKNLEIQDPSFRHWTDNETRQIIIAGMGELHLDVSVERLRREYGIDIESKQQKVSYRETFTKKKKIDVTFKKQTGGPGSFARVVIEFAPIIDNEDLNSNRVLNDVEKKAEIKSIQKRINQWGIKLEELESFNRDFIAEINQLNFQQLAELKEIRNRVERDAWEKRKKKYSVSNEFINNIRGGVIPEDYVKGVRKSLKDELFYGLMLGYPIIDTKATLIEGETHVVDSDRRSFGIAARLALQGDGVKERSQRIQDFGVILLEPIMQVEAIVPKDCLGDALADLGRRRAVIENSNEKENNSYIHCKVPLKKMLNYLTILRQITKGQGEYSMQFSYYQEVPKNALEEILKEKKLQS